MWILRPRISLAFLLATVSLAFVASFAKPADTALTGSGTHPGASIRIAADALQTTVIRPDGSLWAWGVNSSGQLGDGTLVSKNTPTQVGRETNWASLAGCTVAMKSDGSLWSWGANSLGQLGDGTFNSRNTPSPVGLATKWVAAASRNSHTVALKSDGTLWSWGYNYFGQVGIGTSGFSNEKVNLPAQIGQSTDWTTPAAGYFHSLAIKTNGTLWAWGGNDSGQLGDGTFVSKSVPVSVGQATNWIAAAGGWSHSVGLQSDGTLWSWGGFVASPARIGQGSNWVALAAGEDHTIALKSDGTLWAWGWNAYGQLGDGSLLETRPNVPTQVGRTTNWVMVAAGGNRSAAIKANGTLWAWGDNYDGLLGRRNWLIPGPAKATSPGFVWNILTGSLINDPADDGPTISGVLEQWTAQNHVLGPIAITVGEFGTPPESLTLTAESSDDSVVQPDGVTFSGAGSQRTLTITPVRNHTGRTTINVWVSDGFSMNLTHFEVIVRPANDPWADATPIDGQNVTILGSTREATREAGEPTHGGYLGEKSVWWTWSAPASGRFSVSTEGSDFDTALGIYSGDSLASLTPVASNDDFDGNHWSRVEFSASAGTQYRMAVDGYNGSSGTVKLSIRTVDGNSPPTIAGLGGQFLGRGEQVGPIRFVVSDSETTASNLAVTATTSNPTLIPASNIILTGTGADRFISMTPVSGRFGIAAVVVRAADSGGKTASGSLLIWVLDPRVDRAILAAGNHHSALIKADGSLWTWGDYGYGQLGQGTRGSSLVPARVGRATNWMAVAAGAPTRNSSVGDDGGNHTLALKTDGTLWAWGANDSGQLGIGTYANRNLPTQVGHDTDWIAVTAGGRHSAALKKDRSLWVWGNNTSYQLGVGATAAIGAGPGDRFKNVPTRIDAATDWATVAAGGDHTVALKSNGILLAWGSNQAGQVGDGTLGISNGITQFDLANDWMTVAAGGTHSLALKSNGSLWAWGLNSSGQIGDGTIGSKQTSPFRAGQGTNWVAIAAGGDRSAALRSDGSLWTWGRNASPTPTRVDQTTQWVAIASGTLHTLALKSDGTLWGWGSSSRGELGIGDQLGTNTPTFVRIPITGTPTIGSIPNQVTGQNVPLGPIAIQVSDSDSALDNLTLTAESDDPSLVRPDDIAFAGTGSERTMTLVPMPGRSGRTGITVRVSDGVLTEMTRFELVVRPGNDDWAQAIPLSGLEPTASGLNHDATREPGEPSHGGITAGKSLWWTWTAPRDESVTVSTEGSNFDTALGIYTGGLVAGLKSIAGNNDHAGNKWSQVQFQAPAGAIFWIAVDGNNGSSGAIVLSVRTVDDNVPPSISGLPVRVFGGKAPTGPIEFTVSDPETPASQLVVAAASSNPELVPDQNIALAGTGSNRSITVTPMPGRKGIAAITVRVSDGAGRTASQSMGFWILDQRESRVRISADGAHTVLIKNDGSLWTWGRNSLGQLGDGTTVKRNSPTPVGRSTDWLRVACGSESTYALKADRTLWAWGSNEYGRLGDGTLVDKNGPLQVDQATDWITVTAGNYHVAALKQNGTLWAWGDNSSGQLGDGTFTRRYRPVQVGQATDWITVATGTVNTFGLKSDGTLWAWGHANIGQLGNGTSGDGTRRNVPGPVGLDRDWVAVAAGSEHVVALKSNGTLWIWGRKLGMPFGNSSRDANLVPVPVSPDSTWVAIAAGNSHALALQADGTLWAWGLNFYGQLGDGTFTDRSVPTQVGRDTDWIDLATGAYYTLALKSDRSLWAWGSGYDGQLGISNSPTQGLNGVNVPTYVLNTAAATPTISSIPTQWIVQNQRLGPIDIAVSDSDTPLEDLTLTATSSDPSVAPADTIRFDGTGARRTVTVVPRPNATGRTTITIQASDGAFSDWTSFDLVVRPANDRWENATKLSGAAITTTGSNREATQELGEPVHVAATGGKSVWWAWTSPADATLSLSTKGSAFDTALAVYSGPSLSTLRLLAANDNVSDGSWSDVAVRVPAGTTVWIAVDGANGTSGDVVLALRVADGNLPPMILGLGSRMDGTGSPLSPIAFSVTDAETVASELTVTAASSNPELLPPGNIILGGSGANRNLSLTPRPGQTGSAEVTVTVRDSAGATASVIVWVWITDPRLSRAEIAAEANHTLLLKGDGTLWAWGSNASGQLGDGTTNHTSIPIQIGTGTNWAAVAVGSSNSIALKQDGTLWSWGANHDGRLGDGTTTDRPTPRRLGSETGWSAIAAGSSHTLALKSDGSLWAWGLNGEGQLGDDTAVNRNSPTRVGRDTDWTVIAAGFSQSFAVKSNGTLWAWGLNTSGQLGDGTRQRKTAPTRVGWDTDWVKVVAGGAHTLALKSNGTVWSWGSDSFGQLGGGVISAKLTPTQVGRASDWVTLAAGWSHSGAIQSDGTLWMWGSNSYGELGDGTTLGKAIPTQVGQASNWVALATAGLSYSNSQTFALQADGTLSAWGSNDQGQLGSGPSGRRKSAPTQVGRDSDWIEVSAGWQHTAARKSSGAIWAWGENGWGQLGDGTYLDKTIPTWTVPGTNWIAVSAGTVGTLGLKSDGSLWSWGGNYNGQLGTGTTSSSQVPVQVGGTNDWVAAIMGGGHSVARKANGTLWTWGVNSSGQLGFPNRGYFGPFSFPPSQTDRSAEISLHLGGGRVPTWPSPTQVGQATNWAAFAAGSSHTAALKSDGTLWIWGANNSGQLGIGSLVNQSAPIQVGFARDWTVLAAGVAHTVALKSNGTLWAWGSNSEGQLGDGTFGTQIIPMQVGRATDWQAIAANASFTLALKSDGSLWSWGQNTEGQLGDGTFRTRNTPLRIGRIANWSRIAAGPLHAAGIRSDGTLWTWGDNTYAQLGNGTSLTATTPKFVMNLLNAPPSIAPIPTQFAAPDPSLASIAFTIGDPDTPLANLKLSAESSDSSVVQPDGITFNGAGANRTSIVLPVPGATGRTTITFLVTDGSTHARMSFDFIVVPSIIDPGQPSRVELGILLFPEDGRIAVGLSGESGRRYEIDVSEDMRTWRVLRALTLTNEAFWFFDEEVNRIAPRFYRAVARP